MVRDYLERGFEYSNQWVNTARLKEKLALGFSFSRSMLYAAENFSLPVLEALAAGRFKPDNDRPRRSLNELKEDYSYLLELLRRDARNMAEGIYPMEDVELKSFWEHWIKYALVLWDGVRVSRRRRLRKHKDFQEQELELAGEAPEYYRRNFHFQTGGYFSRLSAELYDHQVDILFSGSSDAMRRLILPPLRRHFGNTDGRGLRFLEIGVGTGRATRFVRRMFPKAHICVVDLSDAYLKKAQDELKSFLRIDFVKGDAANLPFRDETFDATYSIFLFHELPSDVRHKILKESFRILKPGGFLGLVDSIQKNDQPHFNFALEQFPIGFHEPFYKNYVESKMEAYLQAYETSGVNTEIGFLSKACWTSKLK